MAERHVPSKPAAVCEQHPRSVHPHSVQYYSSVQHDFVDSPDQSFRVGDDWTWYHGDSCGQKMLFALVYAIFWVVAFVYAHATLHLRIVGKRKLRIARHKGYFMYANHTQPFGDICITVLENLSLIHI